MDSLQGSEIQEEKKFKIASHAWNEGQTTFLLEQIIVQIERGLGTDNSNLKKEAWTAVRVAMELKFKVKFDVRVMKNKKAALSSLYKSYRFLQDQSGFGWDGEKHIVTADESVWAALFEAHPKRGFEKIKDKEFIHYEMCNIIFEGKVATGASSGTVGELLERMGKRNYSSSGSELEVEGEVGEVKQEMDNKGESKVETFRSTGLQRRASAGPDLKRKRSSKHSNIMEGIGNFTDVLRTSLAGLQSSPAPSTTTSSFQSPSVFESKSDLAMDALSEAFLNQVSSDVFVRFVEVLEDETKARTFLKLTSNGDTNILKTWLSRQCHYNSYAEMVNEISPQQEREEVVELQQPVEKLHQESDHDTFQLLDLESLPSIPLHNTRSRKLHNQL